MWALEKRSSTDIVTVVIVNYTSGEFPCTSQAFVSFTYFTLQTDIITSAWLLVPLILFRVLDKQEERSCVRFHGHGWEHWPRILRSCQFVYRNVAYKTPNIQTSLRLMGWCAFPDSPPQPPTPVPWTRAWTINPQTGNILKCVLYTYHDSTKSSLEHQSEAGWLSRPTRVLPHFGPSADPFRPFKMMVGAITAVDRLLLHFSGHSGPSLMPPFHGFITNHFTPICSSGMTVMHQERWGD